MPRTPIRVVPDPSRVRSVPKSFGWIDHRFLRDGHLPRLTLDDLGLYLFLVLAAGADGVSYYRKEKICDALGLSFGPFEAAKSRLQERDLIAFRPFSEHDLNGYYQVLSLPESSVSEAAARA